MYAKLIYLDYYYYIRLAFRGKTDCHYRTVTPLYIKSRNGGSDALKPVMMFLDSLNNDVTDVTAARRYYSICPGILLFSINIVR